MKNNRDKFIINIGQKIKLSWLIKPIRFNPILRMSKIESKQKWLNHDKFIINIS
jgi:hypothetical protein